MPVIGRKVNTGTQDGGWGSALANGIRGVRLSAPASDIWIYAIGARVGKFGGTNASMQFGLYDLDSGGIDDLIEECAAFTASTVMNDSYSGENYERELLAPRLWNGGSGIGVVVRGSQPWAFGMGGSDAYLYTASGGDLPSNMNGAPSSIELTMSAYVVGETNVKPDTPLFREPSGSSGDTKPTFEGNFRDDNESLPGFSIGEADKLYKVAIALRTYGGSNFWTTEYFATGPEVTARRFSIEYPGTLAPGNYQWQCKVMDRAGAWSSWSDWLDFTVTSSGTATAIGPPGGKVTDLTPDLWWYRWVHGSGTAMSKLRLIIKRNGSTFHTSPDITEAAAVNTNGNVTYAQIGSPVLQPGTSYTYHVQGWDGTSWSALSSGFAFNTNAAPTTPANLSPESGSATATRPEITFQGSDPDDPTSTLVGSIRFYNDETNVLIGTYAAAYDAVRNVFYLQTTATHLPTLGVRYRYECQLSDGSLTSAWAAATLTYASGPTPTITAPTASQVFATASIGIQWSVSGGTQDSWRVRLYDQTTGKKVYETPRIYNSIANYYPDPKHFYDEGSYRVQVDVWDAAGLLGTSADRLFSVDFPRPPAINTRVSGYFAEGDLPSDPSAAKIEWDAMTGYTTEEFQGYRIRRTEVGKPETRKVIAFITNPATLEYVDDKAGINKEFEYDARTVIQYASGQRVEGLGSPAIFYLRFRVATISDVRTGERVVLPFYRDRDVDYLDDAVLVPTWGNKPVKVGGAFAYRVLSGTFELVDDPMNGRYSALMIERLVRFKGVRDDLSPVIVCYRDRRERVIFGTVMKARVRDIPGVSDRYSLQLEIAETDYDEDIGE